MGRDGAAIETARGGYEGREWTSAKAEAILKGAMREFLAHGYAAASMDRIAATAGVSKATVYSHFGDKERLFAALVEHLTREKSRAIFDAPDAALLEGAPRDALSHLLTTMLDAVTSDPDLVDFIRLAVGESRRFPALVQVAVERIHQPIIAALGAYLAAHPEWRLADPEAVARIVFGALLYEVIVEVVLRSDSAAPPVGHERLLAGLVDLLTPRAGRTEQRTQDHDLRT